MADPATGAGVIVNTPSGEAGGRAVGSSLAVFADPLPAPVQLGMRLGLAGLPR